MYFQDCKRIEHSNIIEQGKQEWLLVQQYMRSCDRNLRIHWRKRKSQMKNKRKFHWPVNHETASVYVYSFRFLLSKYVQALSWKAATRPNHLSNIYKIKGEKNKFLTEEKLIFWGTLPKFSIKIKLPQVRKKAQKETRIFCYRLAKIQIPEDFNPKNKLLRPQKWN